ncbi:MAG: SUMF1/EgtB/PvdO family nonheme iron enzyme [Magnetococcales bacterium]|nr:SUMF1/EgtB/PvdO family nonheme iron enzyme [Magnetococcales bacterium]
MEAVKKMIFAMQKIEEKSGFKVDQVIFHSQDIFNASAGFSYAGKATINVYHGMFKTLQDDLDAWAALFGHEIAHVVRQHQFQSDSERLSKASVKAVGDVARRLPGMAGALSQVAVELVGMGVKGAFNRPQEEEADQLGLKWMTEAGFDPKGMERLTQHMVALQGDGVLLEFLLTHPAPANRLNKAREFLATQGGQPSAFSNIDWSSTNELLANLKRRIPVYAAAEPEPLTNMAFVRVEGGTFRMGCMPVGELCFESDRVMHEVRVDSFEIAAYEVTQEQWQKVMGSNPSQAVQCGSNCPVERVSWEDAQQFIARLNEQGEGGYRLPTEAEWEFACRSGGMPLYHCGERGLSDHAWEGDNSWGRLHPVGTKAPNRFGLYDMTGNVREWVADWYDAGYYAASPKENPTGPASGKFRVVRGGDYDSQGLRMLLASYRDSGFPDVRREYIGLRLARTVKEQKSLNSP